VKKISSNIRNNGEEAKALQPALCRKRKRRMRDGIKPGALNVGIIAGGISGKTGVMARMA